MITSDRAHVLQQSPDASAVVACHLSSLFIVAHQHSQSHTRRYLLSKTLRTIPSSCAGNPNHEVTMDANVEVTLLTTADEAPDDLLLEYDITRPSAGQLQLTDLCVRGKADAGTAADGLPTFAALSKAAVSLCQFSQMPALDTMAAEVVLLIKANSLSTVCPADPA